MEWVVLVLLVWLWRVNASRGNKLAQRIDEQQELIQKLTRRVFELEQSSTVRIPAAVTKPVIREPEPEREIALPPVMVAPEDPVAAGVVEEPVYIAPPAPAPVLEPPSPPPPPEPTFADRMRGQNWEAMIGGSWLNALGILVMVVSLALFLGYALTQFGPAGKVSIGIVMAVAMLAAGVFIERREAYVTFGRGLLAGGWAILYFVAYAMHALDAARVIESPIVGGILLLVVAGGMIAHSLRYRSQNLTLLAYASAYFALQIGPQSALSIVATVPLAASLLTISRELGWSITPIAGMVLTYFTFAFRYDPAELNPTFGVAALYAYWLAFELYDLLKVRAAAQRAVIELTIFPLNAFLFIGTAFLTLPKSTPIQSSYFLASAGAVFLVSTVLRMRWKADLALAANPVEQMLLNGHRIAAAFSSALFAGALLRRFSTERSAVGLLMEAQLLVLAGLRTGERFFCHLGAVVFGGAALAVFFRGAEFGGMEVNGSHFSAWVPYVIWMAGQYYFNRWLTRGYRFYSWGALALLMVATGEATGPRWSGTIWIAMAVVLLEVFLRSRLREFIQQGAVAAVLGFLVLWISGSTANSAELTKQATLSSAGAVLLYYATWRLTAARLENRARDFASLLATILASLALWQLLPAPLAALAWGGLALVLLEAGFGWGVAWLRWQGHAMALCAFGWVFVANFPIFSETAGISHRLLTVIPLIGLAWHGWRRTPPDLHRIDATMRHAYSWAGVILLAALLRFELGRMLVVLGWAAMMVGLLYVGTRRQIRDFQLQAYVLAVLTFARGWATNFNSDETLLGMPVRVATGVFVIAAFYAAEFLCSREERYTRPAFAVMGSALMSILLYYEISGRLLTIAWGIQGAATLAAGFATRERVLRFIGLGLFANCILKLFLYDLRNLDTLGRIFSTFVLGLVLLGASWLYMRFKDKIQRYL